MKPSEYYRELANQKEVRNRGPKRTGRILRGTSISTELGLLDDSVEETDTVVYPIYGQHLRG